MLKEKIIKLCSDFNIKLSEDQISLIVKEYENIDKDVNPGNMEILARIKIMLEEKIPFNNRLNGLLDFSIGKTSLNYHISYPELNKIIGKLTSELKNEKLIYDTFYSYLKNNFIEALVKSVSIIIENPNLNKIAVNDTFIKDNMPLFDELGFIIKILSDEELNMLFPYKTSEEKESLRYYAYILRDKYLSIFGN